MNGNVCQLINVFQNRFIVMEKLTAKTKVMKSDAVRIPGLILLSNTHSEPKLEFSNDF